MALKYHLVKRRDMSPQAAGDPTKKKFYGQIRANGRLTFDMLCAEISRVSTASRGDVQLVIATMIESMREHLLQGYIVEVGELGNFRMSVGSTGAETEKEFTVHYFKRSKVVFTPGEMLRKARAEITYEKLLPVGTKTEGTGEDDEGGEGF